VDGGTAAASEILAGALQDHDRAVLVGDTTFGEGLAQQLYPLRGTQGALALTVSRYLTPSGRAIHRGPLASRDDDEADDDSEESPATDSSAAASTRAYRTDAGRVVRGGLGLAPDVRVAADTAAVRLDRHAPGGPAAAARESLARDRVFQRALDALRRASDARGVFAAAGLKLPTGPGARR